MKTKLFILFIFLFNFNIFSLERNKSIPLFNSMSNENYISANKNNIFFLNDKSGYNNLYYFNKKETSIKKIFPFNFNNISDIHYNNYKNIISFISFENDLKGDISIVYFDKKFNVKNQIFISKINEEDNFITQNNNNLFYNSLSKNGKINKIIQYNFNTKKSKVLFKKNVLGLSINEKNSILTYIIVQNNQYKIFSYNIKNKKKK